MKAPHLQRALGLFPAVTLVLGSVIGSGIFVSSASMARHLPSGWHLLGVWVFAGVMTALGALTQGEICGQMPVSGGLYSYFKELLGPSVAFFYGWANFMIAGSGAIAALAYVFAGYMGEFVPLYHPPAHIQAWTIHIPYLGTLYPGANLGQKLVASVLILGLTALNVRGVRFGSWVQSASASAKTLAILIIIGTVLFFGHGSLSHLTSVNNAAPSEPWSPALLGAWVIAMSGAFWAYDGWGNVAYIGDEVKNPSRNLPLAILLGTGLVIAVYCLINLSYIYILPVGAIGAAEGDRVASAVMKTVVGMPGVRIVALLILLCTFDTTNSSILTNGRVYYAMARENSFWKKAGTVHPRYDTPHIALWMQGLWSVTLLISGSFDLVTSMYVFVNWAFYFLIPVSLFVLRWRTKGKKRSGFRVPGYPFVPAIFALFTVGYCLQTLVGDIRAYSAGQEPCVKSLMGVALVLSGTPYFFWLRYQRRVSRKL